MERRTIKMTTLVVILSILSVILEFAVYYFTDLFWSMAVTTTLTCIILSHILLEVSLSYETGLTFSILSILFSTIGCALIYFDKTGGLFEYRNFLPILVFLHWIVPMLYFIFRCLWDKGPRFVSFNSYFTKASIVFAIYYSILFVYHTIFDPIAVPYAFQRTSNSFIPFFCTATHIEDFIYMGTGLYELLLYLVKLFALFAPIGFYVSLLVRNYSKKAAITLKLLLCLIIPLIFEGISYFQGSFINIDSYLYRLFGILLGILLFQMLNSIFLSVTGEAFLHERNQYSFFLN